MVLGLIVLPSDYAKLPNTKTRKTPWYNHPAVQMWKGFEVLLTIYGLIICAEWGERGFKDSISYQLLAEMPGSYGAFANLSWYKIFRIKAVYDSFNQPDWLGNERFHLSHRSNLIRKFPEHYNPLFGNDVPDDLPYFWPTKKGEKQ